MASTSKFEEEEDVIWTFRDDFDVVQKVQIKLFYLPTKSVRLFSPRNYFKEEKEGSFTMDQYGRNLNFKSDKILKFKNSFM